MKHNLIIWLAYHSGVINLHGDFLSKNLHLQLKLPSTKMSLPQIAHCGEIFSLFWVLCVTSTLNTSRVRVFPFHYVLSLRGRWNVYCVLWYQSWQSPQCISQKKTCLEKSVYSEHLLVLCFRLELKLGKFVNRGLNCKMLHFFQMF